MNLSEERALIRSCSIPAEFDQNQGRLPLG